LIPPKSSIAVSILLGEILVAVSSLEAWQSGNTNRLYAMHVREMKEAPTVWWRLLDHRNAKWVPRIEAAIKSGKPTLVVAGALHFSGPRSVIALLQTRGYKIEQL
jgi:uncharacterized protein